MPSPSGNNLLQRGTNPIPDAEQQEHRAVEGGAEADDIRIVFHLRTGHDDHHQHRYTGDQVEQNLSFQGVILFFSAIQDSP